MFSRQQILSLIDEIRLQLLWSDIIERPNFSAPLSCLDTHSCVHKQAKNASKQNCRLPPAPQNEIHDLLQLIAKTGSVAKSKQPSVNRISNASTMTKSNRKYLFIMASFKSCLKVNGVGSCKAFANLGDPVTFLEVRFVIRNNHLSCSVLFWREFIASSANTLSDFVYLLSVY